MAYLALSRRSHWKDISTDGLTPFAALINRRTILFDHERWLTDEILDLCQVFLEHKQDPNIAIPTDQFMKTFDKDLWCRPLHLIESPRWTKLLLEHGAKVNALDSYGRTPLDLAYGGGKNPWRYECITPETFESTRILLEAGGCLTHGVDEPYAGGKTLLEIFYIRLDEAGIEPTAAMKRSPLLDSSDPPSAKVATTTPVSANRPVPTHSAPSIRKKIGEVLKRDK